MRKTIALSIGLAACAAGVSPAALASAAESLKLTVSSPAALGQPLTITATGVADGSHRVYVYADETRSACAATPNAEYAQRAGSVALAGYGGEALPAGGFTKSYTYTPTYQLPVLCGYLDEAGEGAPDVSATESEPVREYLEHEGQAQPVSVGTSNLPGAIEPQPVNQQKLKEFWARIEAERARQERERAAQTSARRCVVPALKGRSLRSARRALKHAHCALGRVTAHRHGKAALVVAAQKPARGKRLRAGAPVEVTLGIR